MLCLLLAIVLGFRASAAWSRFFLFVGGLMLFVTTFTTFGYVLITPLENRFVRPAEPAHIDGIVVLGGAMDGEVNSVRGGWELNRSGDRYVETLRLALAHPEAKVLVAAGPAALALEQEREAVAAKRMLTSFGIAAERIVLDESSRNTEEIAQFAKELAGPVDGQTWLLVTSAFHMPRSVGLVPHRGLPGHPVARGLPRERREGWRIKPTSPRKMSPSRPSRCGMDRARGLQAHRQDRRLVPGAVSRIVLPPTWAYVTGIT